MHSLYLNQPAFSSNEIICETADSFCLVADALHAALIKISSQTNVSSAKAYALITEEYGLRTRLGILRGDSDNRVVHGVGITHNDFLGLLSDTASCIQQSHSIEKIASVVNTVSLLCVAIFPGKNEIVNFLLQHLRKEVRLPV